MVKTVAEIIKELIEANEKNETVDLNKVKCKASAKYGLPIQPRLTDIISAVPIQYKKVLLPKLRAKPVRTASGVRLETTEILLDSLRTYCLTSNDLDRRRRRHVQTTSMSSHCHDWKYLVG